ncbi:MAG: (Fe-S)-binding protein [Gemmatimonadota bacterium]|nr:MAG: (Fe-S)-binding protein [Gemmatimonadota bacterium]
MPRVALFVTCMVDTLYPEVGLAAVDLLERHGAEVVFPEEQTCCGQPAFNAGYRVEARRMAVHFLDVFAPLVESGDVDAIVAPSGSCVAMVKRFYDVLFEGPNCINDQPRVARTREVTYELTQYLVDVLGVDDTAAQYNGTLTYHPCCHLLRELGIDKQPRRLLNAITGADLVELPAATECCGFGGLFALKNAEISTAMGQRKLDNIDQTGAHIVAVNDVSCMTHINGLLKRAGHPCRAAHVAQLLRPAEAGEPGARRT